MLGKIFGIMTFIALVFGIITGRIEQVGGAAMSGAGKAVTLVISLAGAMCFWSGIMRVLDKTGVTAKITKAINPLLRLLFPRLARENRTEVLGDISANISANLLGLGNAATPAGLKAMQKLKDINPAPGKASREMITFVLINCAAIQILPTTLISLRAAAGSVNPSAIIVPVWICSVAGFVLTVIICRFIRK